MKLPNGANAYITSQKLDRYLLSETHPIGRAKAKFLRGLGFDESTITMLERALIATAQSEEVKETISSVHGTKYVIDGMLQTPSGRLVGVRTVWIIDRGQERPRLVTAYPV